MRSAFHISVTFVLGAAVATLPAWAVRPARAQTLLGPLGVSLFQPMLELPGVPGPRARSLYSNAPLPYQGSTRLPDSVGPAPGLACRAAIRAAERAAAIPNQLMAAIGRVESGRREPDGTVDPWPWSVNAEGESHIYASKPEAVAAVRAMQANGMRSIDIGCMQVNLQHHPDAFTSLEQAFAPVANAAYAARFLRQLHDQSGAWPTATAWYHSQTPDLGADYQRKVMAVLPEEQKRAEATPPAAAIAAAPRLPTSPVGFAGGAAGGLPGAFVRNVTMPNTAPVAHMIPLPQGAVGRTLSAYRAAPVMVIARPALAPPPVRGARAADAPG